MEYIIHLAILVMIYIGLAVSLNMIVGSAGILSLSHAAFYGIGAYSTAILLTSLKLGFLWSCFAGMAISAIYAYLISLAFSGLKKDFYALGSFGISVVTYSLFLNLSSVTKGSAGIFGIQRPILFGLSLSSNLAFLVFIATVSIAIVLIITALTKSHFGRILKAIRDDEDALLAFGYEPRKFKHTVFVIGAVVASIFGSLYAIYISFIDPSSFSLNESIFILTIIIVGGLDSIKGAIAGTLFLVLLPESLRLIGIPGNIAAEIRVMLFGSLLVILMLNKQNGILGKYTFQ